MLPPPAKTPPSRTRVFAALGLLVACGAFAAWMLWGSGGTGSTPAPSDAVREQADRIATELQKAEAASAAPAPAQTPAEGSGGPKNMRSRPAE